MITRRLLSSAQGEPAGAMAKLAPAFYEDAVLESSAAEWGAWLAKYAARLRADGRVESERQAEMRLSSPKYVPREWMLVLAYEAAEKGELDVLHELEALFRRPFDEQPALADKYYQRTPDEYRQKAGVSYFS